MQTGERILTLSVSLAFSLTINSAVFFSIDHAFVFRENGPIAGQRELLRKKNDRIEFEFVEAPAKRYTQKPAASKKISDRDALSQDLLKENAGGSALPRVKQLGSSDQLAQRRAKGPVQQSQPAAPETPEAKQPAEQPSAEKTGQGPADASITIQARTKPAQSARSAEPKPAVIGLTGQDKITTQEMTKVKSAGAQLYGSTSFEATGSGMGRYMKNLKEKIWLRWFPYLAFKYPQDFQGADAVISFKLDANGEVKILKVLESRGSPLFASFCMEAIQRASGFGPLPEEILALVGNEGLEIRFGFHYR